MKCSTPELPRIIIDCNEKEVIEASVPLSSAAMKNTGSPSGTVMTMACQTEPVSTPRRRLALLKAKVAADKNARKPASTGDEPSALPSKPEAAGSSPDPSWRALWLIGKIGAGEGIRTLDP